MLHAADEAGLGNEGEEDDLSAESPSSSSKAEGSGSSTRPGRRERSPARDRRSARARSRTARPPGSRPAGWRILVRPVHKVAGDELSVGTIMLWLSPLMIVVARMLMRSTLPVVPATVTTSPIRIGRSRSMMIPQTSWKRSLEDRTPGPRPGRPGPCRSALCRRGWPPARRWTSPPARRIGKGSQRRTGHPGRRRSGKQGQGEQRAHVSPGHASQQDHDGRLGQVAKSDGCVGQRQ